MEEKMKLKTIDELFKEIKLIPESELTKEYNKKESNRDETIESKFRLEDASRFGEFIGGTSLVSADFTDRYGLVFFDLCHDPGYRGGMNGCAYSSQLQLADLDNITKKLLVETYNYRGTGNCPFNHRINFSQGKILRESGDEILFGIKSHELLKFHSYNTKTGEKKDVESVDLEYARRNEEKLEKFDKAFKELDTDAIKDFLSESNYFTTVKKISDGYALVMLHDPYGDTGSRHAKTKLVIKNKGVMDIKHHSKQFSGSHVTQGFDLEDAKIKYDGEKLILSYVIGERDSYHTDSGAYRDNTLGRTTHETIIDPKELDLSLSKDMRLEYLIDKETKNLLSYGNTNKIPVMMHGFRQEAPINYAYRIDKVEDKGKTYLLVSKIIDMEHYDRNQSGIFAVEQQLKVELYEAKDIDGKEPKLRQLTEFTTDTNDRKKYVMNVDYDSEKNEMKIPKPRIELNEKEFSILYKVKGHDFDEKEIKLRLS